jgi:hypothetical protein
MVGEAIASAVAAEATIARVTVPVAAGPVMAAADLAIVPAFGLVDPVVILAAADPVTRAAVTQVAAADLVIRAVAIQVAVIPAVAIQVAASIPVAEDLTKAYGL